MHSRAASDRMTNFDIVKMQLLHSRLMRSALAAFYKSVAPRAPARAFPLPSREPLNGNRANCGRLGQIEVLRPRGDPATALFAYNIILYTCKLIHGISAL